jgi:hypothetical protein
VKPIRLECYLRRVSGLFSVAVDINSSVFDFYFLIWSLSRLLCCDDSGFNVAAASSGQATSLQKSVSDSARHSRDGMVYTNFIKTLRESTDLLSCYNGKDGY